MTVTKKLEGTKLTATIEGRMDTNTTPQAEKELAGSLDNVKELILDFNKLDYISSAGLRLLLMLQNQQVHQADQRHLQKATLPVHKPHSDNLMGIMDEEHGQQGVM